MKNSCLLFWFLLTCSMLFAQKKNAAFHFDIQQTDKTIKIDGLVEEPAWKDAAVVRDFFMVLPMDTSLAQVKTEVSMTYDSSNLYLYAVCYKKIHGSDVVESLRRDFDFTKNDNFILFMDPFDDRTNGYAFGTNAVGAQWDAQLYEGGKADLNWDNVWRSAVKDYDDRWVVEMAIPFKAVRFKKGVKNWGVNFSRNDVGSFEKSSWAPVPRQFPTASLAYTGYLQWDKAPPQPGSNIALLPYLVTGVSKSYNPPGANSKKLEAGLDAKIALSSSLNLDLTVNPDFSQVEVDKQVTNLDRYELFFPERRQFFLENGDQLNNFGYPNIRPFFSRRIGLASPIQFGGRVSGRFNAKWRITAMDVETAKVEKTAFPNQNFSVLALQRKVFSRSNISLLFVNRQAVNFHPEKDSLRRYYASYNRNIGLEYNLATVKNLWSGKMLLLKSFSPGVKDNSFTYAGNLQYAGKRWLINGAYESVGKTFDAEVGYVPRKDYIKLNPQISYFFFPQKGTILTHGPQYAGIYFFNQQFSHTDHANTLSYLITYRNRATLSAVLLEDDVRLLFAFDPTNSGKDSLQTGSVHRWKTAGIDFVSKQSKTFTYAYAIRYGGYYADGKKFTLSSSVGYRYQPYLNISFNVSYNELRLPQPWGHTSFWLVGPKIDLTMTNKLFFTTYIQYNQQLKNTNINARFQWRYKPGSDFYLVYTDNYLITPFSVRNRAILLKFNYWWNI